MNKRLIPILITAISTAIIGLIFIQIYWINSALTLRVEEFNRNAIEALNDVVEQLEKEETLSRLRSHKEAKFLFFDRDSASSFNATVDDLTNCLSNYASEKCDSICEHIVFKEITNNKNQINVRLVEQINGKKESKEFSTSTNKNKWTDEEKALLSNKLNIEVEQDKSNDDLKKTHQEQNIDSLLKKRVVHKTAFVGDIVKRLMEVNLFEKIEDRVSIAQLDTLLKEAFRNRGIPTEFDFGVYHTGGAPVFVKSENEEQLRQSALKIKLFPNDVVDSNSFLKIWFPQQRAFLIHQLWWMLLLSVVIILAIITIFISAVKTIISQKEISEIKNDFINNMTHELKTPISTISLACEALSDDTIARNSSIYKRYISMINDENKRLALLVENVLQSAILDKGTFELKLEEIDMHHLIDAATSKFEMQLKKRNGKIIKNFRAKNHIINADGVHTAHIISNLIDNALKYTENEPIIEINTTSNEKYFKLSITDNGIGISKINQQKIFDKLYRVPTGNVHNAKGFGLGLSYVKIIVERLGGAISVKSELGKGSTFCLEFPLKNERQN